MSILRHSIHSRPFQRGVYRFIHSGTAQSKPIAFAFDIDGVLLQGSQVLPEAKRALKILGGQNSRKEKIPFILMTNGGGVSEEDRCKQLSSQLGIKLDTLQLIQAHTPLRDLPHLLRTVEKTEEDSRLHPRDPVLVLGGIKDNVRKIADGYGFKNVYTPKDVLAWNPNIWPFYTLSEDDRLYVRKVDFSKIQFGSIMVFHDPRHWSLDIQVMLDILLSKNRSPNGPRGKPKQPVELIFCNPDLLWRGALKTPRLGQGAFIEAFQAVYKSITGEYYPYTQYGKPLKATFDYAEAQLMKYSNVRFPHITDQPKIYMIGDNPASDIAGANAANWSSVLVHTGVYDPETGPPTHTPTHQTANVEEAVKWALGQEGYLT